MSWKKKDTHFKKKSKRFWKNELEKSPFTFLEKRFAVVFSKKKRSLISRIGEKRFFEWKWFFNIFFVWEIGKIKRRFLQSAFVKRLLKALFIFIYHISAFFFETMIHCFSIQNWEISIQKWRFLHSNFFRSVSNLLFWNLSVFFSSAFSPFGMEKSPFRMEISPFQTFSYARYEPFFLKCVFLFSSRPFSQFRMENSPSNFWTEISPCWMEIFSILTTDFISCIQNKENSILNSQISILRKKSSSLSTVFFLNCFLHSEWRSGEISILNGEISSFWMEKSPFWMEKSPFWMEKSPFWMEKSPF